MPLRIQEINIQQAGPLSQFKMKLDSFNLIYGQNEQGKTHLVEFLLRSLFRSAKKWGLRDEKGIGKIILSGLSQEVTTFSPSSEKLEDLWEYDRGLPPDFSRLLVVKGAELEIADSKETDQVVLKKYLSGQQILDVIEKRISPTTQKAQINEGILYGDQRGEIKRQADLRNRLTQILDFFNQIDKGYSGGNRKAISQKLEACEKDLNDLNKAKCFLAHQLSQKKKDVEEHIRKINVSKIQEAQSLFAQYKQKQYDLNRREFSKNEEEDKARNYQWLIKAREIYQEKRVNPKIKIHSLFIILTSFLMVCTFGFLYFQLWLESIITLSLMVFSGSFTIRYFYKHAKEAGFREEVKKVEVEFAKRFQTELTNLPLLDSYLEDASQSHHNFNLLRDQVENEKKELSVIDYKLSNLFIDLLGRQVNQSNWGVELKNLEKKVKELESKSNQLDMEIAVLDVESADYVTEDPGVSFSKTAYQKKQIEIQELKDNLKDEIDKLGFLKQLILRFLEEKENLDWDVLIYNLQKRQQEVQAEYQTVTAEILGKIAVFRVLEDLRKDEMKKIREGLSSAEILKPLQRITKRYTQLKIKDEKLICADDFREFPLSDLSTGAKEQVLLALRIGFAQKLTHQEDPLFLILDDAFQHSDWNRREGLVDQVVDLAESGWQIIYLTMDDHIRDLFIKKGKIFKDQFKIAVLKEVQT